VQNKVKMKPRIHRATVPNTNYQFACVVPSLSPTAVTVDSCITQNTWVSYKAANLVAVCMRNVFTCADPSCLAPHKALVPFARNTQVHLGSIYEAKASKSPEPELRTLHMQPQNQQEMRCMIQLQLRKTDTRLYSCQESFSR